MVDSTDPMEEPGAWKRAKEDAAAVYRSVLFGLALTVAGLVAVSSAVLWTDGPNTATKVEIAVPILAGVGASLLCLSIVFAIQLAAAPFRQRNEAREEVRRLRADPFVATRAADAERNRASVRIAVGQVSEELERMASLFGQGVSREWFAEHPLNNAHWMNNGELFAAVDPAAHKVVRRAYRLAFEVEQTKCVGPDGKSDTVLDEQKCAETMEAIHAAIDTLTDVLERHERP